MLQNTFSILSVCLVVLLGLLTLPEESAAFSSHAIIKTRAQGSNVAVAWSIVKYQRRIAVKLSTEEESTTSGESKGVSGTPVHPPVPTTTTLPSKQLSLSSAVEQSSYPIDLPSPILLATSMILAIVGTGSGFDLANSTPRFGFGITFSIATVSLTLSVGLFYASVLKAKAETEADDKEYMRGK